MTRKKSIEERVAEMMSKNPGISDFDIFFSKLREGK